MYKDELSKTEDKILFLVEHFKDKPLRDLELFSTTHYYYAANKGFTASHGGKKTRQDVQVIVSQLLRGCP